MSARVHEVVRVEASGSYDVVIGRGLLDEAGARMRAALPDADATVLLVSDTNVAPLYADRVAASLAAAGFAVGRFTVEAGEASKSLASFGAVLEAAAVQGLTRRSTVVALGGGVVGDLAGFAAAAYMRGCNLVQVATSLLAMVDSSVGGKTAVDLPQGKNLAGAFHQPRLVLCDLDCLATLPAAYVSDGLGEVAKYAVLCDPELFAWLADPWGPQAERIVARCVAIKRDVVEADEHERHGRMLLNLGHTVGHAIELLSDFGVAHGHAVAAGTAVMARACAARGWCTFDDAARIEGLLLRLGLPTASARPAADLARAALRDKKRAGRHIDVVAVHGIGSCAVERLDLDDFALLVEQGCSAAADAVLAERGGGALAERGVDACDPMGGGPLRATVQPGGLGGAVCAISSKSAAHRMLVCAALADGPTRIRCSTTSQDIEATRRCLEGLGARVERTGDVFLVTPRPPAADGDAQRERVTWLDCGESGSTLRFMLPVACALGGRHRFTGAGRLPERPLEPLRARLVEHGCQVSPAGMWPLYAWGRLQGGVFDLPGDVSSQYATGVLLALPLTGQGGCVRLHGTVESRPYIDLTLSVMRLFGVEVAESAEPDEWAADVEQDGAPATCAVFSVAPQARYRSPGEVAVEGDWSNAAFWLCAGALSETPVTVTGLDLATDQGDLGVLDALADLGASVRVHPGEGWATVCGRDLETGAPRALTGCTIDARQVPDLIPVLSMVAACARGETRVVNAARLRIKESDRLRTTGELLERFGVGVEELPDGLVIHGRGRVGTAACLEGCTVSSRGDHRIAMAAAVAAARARGPVCICDAQAVAKSYPGFFTDLARLGGTCELVRVSSVAGRDAQADAVPMRPHQE